MLQARAFLGGYMPVALHIQSTAPSTPHHKNTRLTVSLQHPINPTGRLFDLPSLKPTSTSCAIESIL